MLCIMSDKNNTEIGLFGKEKEKEKGKDNDKDKELDKHWTVQNTNTLLKWITIGSYYIKVLERNIAVNRAIIRFNTIQSIILTTATGSIGVSQMSSIFSAHTQLALTTIFTVMSFFMTITTGVIKVLLIHENLEKCIQVKQEWTSFITNISTELQLPKEERQDAVKLIRDNKMVYLSLLNKDVEINKKSENKAKMHIEKDIEKSRLELEVEKNNISKRKNGRNDTIIDLDYSRKAALHDDFSKMMNSVGISISDITNYIVKTELQAIVDFDLESQYNHIIKKETQIAKAKFSCELQLKQKELETRRMGRETSGSLLLTNSANSTNSTNSTNSANSEDKSVRILQKKIESVEEKLDSTYSDEKSERSEQPAGAGWRNLFNL